MYAVATFLVVAVLTMIFGRLTTGALIATGVPPDTASFQARSALSGAGFTTAEAETVVNHPTRRKIIATTMFVGSLGTPTLVVSVLVGFVAPGPGSTTERTLVIASGLTLMVMMAINRPSQQLLVRMGQRYANRRLIPALADEVNELVSLGDDMIVGSLPLTQDPGQTYRSLRGMRTALTGVTVLGVQQGDRYLGEPPIDVELRKGDKLVVYGLRERLSTLRTEIE
ncbi:MAG: hypothetical protein GY745_13990 [Actinomycetia bacterium]|nr:hypothetical protein [Actinomycetes bacterium]MCP4086147.1 hypothetical protein [Actinomycetes bacterium]